MTDQQPYPATRWRAECGSCHSPIRWVSTENARLMPLDPEPTLDGNVIPHPSGKLDKYGQPIAHVLTKNEPVSDGTFRFTTHWETCPNAKTHRKGKS